MSRKFFGLLAMSGMVLMLAGFSTPSQGAEASFLFFGGGGNCCCVDYDDDDGSHDDDDCCCSGLVGSVSMPAAACCEPASSCCAPAPTCCGAAPALENKGGAAPASLTEAAPALATDDRRI